MTPTAHDNTANPLDPLVPQPRRPGLAPDLVALAPNGVDLVAYGHLPAWLMWAMAVTHVARTHGVETAEREVLTASSDDPEHRWAVEVTDGYCDRPCLVWGGVTAETAGAYPITLVRLGQQVPNVAPSMNLRPGGPAAWWRRWRRRRRRRRVGAETAATLAARRYIDSRTTVLTDDTQVLPQPPGDPPRAPDQP